MAIIKMKKLTAIVLKSDTKKVLRTLHKIGAVEISQMPLAEDAQYAPAEAGQALSRLENELSDVNFALSAIAKHDHSKKPSYLTPKPPMTIEGLEECSAKAEEVAAAVAEIRSIEERLNTLKQKQARIDAQVAQLEPFASLDVPVKDIHKSKYVQTMCGFLPKDSVEQIGSFASDFEGMAYIEMLPTTATDFYPVLVIIYGGVAEAAIARLKELSFSENRFEGFECSCAERIAELKEETAEVLAAQAEEEKVAEDAVKYKELMLEQEDYLKNAIERESMVSKLGATANVNIITGWVKEYDTERVEKVIEDINSASYVMFEDPSEEDSVPTCAETNKLATPFQAVTEMYDTPSYKDFDVSVILSPFYFIFFGMMMGDAAYGLIITVLMAIVIKCKKPPKGSMSRKVMGTLMICGISTFAFGVLFGSWFGEELFPALWFVPTSNAMLMLGACLAVGVVHLIYSMIIGLIKGAKQGYFWDAWCDNGWWLLCLVAVIVIAFSMLLGDGNMTPGLIIVAVAMAGVLFTGGRDKKGIKKVISGLGAMYNVTGVLSDVLSYARIFGMSLATGVIGHVFNTLAIMLFGGEGILFKIIGTVFGVGIIIVGHVFNLAINSLGSFVHSCRLQYIESFPKFFEGGGRAFKPLKYKLTNYRFDD